MFEETLKSQLRDVFQKIETPVILRASLDESDAASKMKQFLSECAALSENIALQEDGGWDRRPSFSVAAQDGTASIYFAAIPMGHELTSFVLAVLQVGGVPVKLPESTIAQIRDLKGDFQFTTYISLSCQNCPEVVQAINAMCILNPSFKHVVVDGALFQDEVTRKNIMTVPQIELNGAPFASGRMDAMEILAKLDVAAPAKAAQQYKDAAPFDVLIIGAGPSGAAAAIYAARKGLRTGIIADRFGGQVMETAGIENYISIPETDGPKLSAQFEAHVRAHEVEIVSGQKAERLIPASNSDAYHQIALSGDVLLSSRTIILATGAHWRHLNVAGETEYLTKGVAFCPHCDGPFYKGKRVAVIGGGNSGVEAAIDLAGIVSHVTLLQRSAQLKADKVLQDKLRSMPNVDIKMEALTQSIAGNGETVEQLTYRDVSGQDVTLPVSGVFIQIGLLPNTGWLGNVLSLNPQGEIIVDVHGATSVPGIFAAGDATTTPYKQIVIAVGEGAKAALGAFDYLIRTPDPAASRQKEAALA